MSMKAIGLAILALGLTIFIYFQMHSAIKESDLDQLLSAPDDPHSVKSEDRAEADAPKRVDQSALRYFANKRDMRRYQREVARLQSLYPDWDPPKDVSELEAESDPELDRLWQLFSEERYTEVRSGIGERQAREPLWVPPTELVNLLDIGEARLRLVDASESGQWDDAIKIAESAPTLLTCENTDVVWRVAEAYVKAKGQQKAKDIYKSILTDCVNDAERLATLQKAARYLPDSDIIDLLRFERNTEFTSLRDDLARKRISHIVDDKNLAATPDDLKRFESISINSSSDDDRLLLGWYYYHRGDGAAALDWFRRVLAGNPSNAKAAEGCTLSLIALGRFAEAEDFGYASATTLASYFDAATKLLSVDPPLTIPREVLERIASVTVEYHNLDAAEGLAWYAHNIGQDEAAALWFDKVLAWEPSDGSAANGLASILAERALDAFASERYADVLRTLEVRGRYAPPQNDLLVLKGFAYLKLNRYREARQIFKTVAATGYPHALRGLAEAEANMFKIRR